MGYTHIYLILSHIVHSSCWTISFMCWHLYYWSLVSSVPESLMLLSSFTWHVPPLEHPHLDAAVRAAISHIGIACLYRYFTNCYVYSQLLAGVVMLIAEQRLLSRFLASSIYVFHTTLPLIIHRT